MFVASVDVTQFCVSDSGPLFQKYAILTLTRTADLRNRGSLEYGPVPCE